MTHSSSGHIYKLSLIINYFADCNCSNYGSNEQSCNGNGQCNCEATFTGRKCDECTPGLKKSNGFCCEPNRFFDLVNFKCERK